MSPSSNPRVLALDPGFDRLGVAVLEKQNGKDTVLYSACITSAKTPSFSVRLAELGQQLETILTTWAPTLVALETLFFSTNRKTASQVSETRGMILYLAGKRGCQTVELNPLSVKLAVTGYGKADKAQVQTMVEKLVPLPPGKRHDDEFDAIAIGLAALAEYRLR